MGEKRGLGCSLEVRTGQSGRLVAEPEPWGWDGGCLYLLLRGAGARQSFPRPRRLCVKHGPFRGVG